jgi:hypothetical protein
MIVVDPKGVPGSIDSTELVSGADMVVGLSGDLPLADARKWVPRKVGALIDEAAALPEVLVHRLGEGVVLVEAVGEAPLVIATGELPEAGRWGRDAVVIVAGKNLPQTAVSVVNEIGPRLLAIAGGEHAIEETIEAVRELLDGTGLMAMEPALALEV